MHGDNLVLVQTARGMSETPRYAHLASSRRRQDLARLLESPKE